MSESALYICRAKTRCWQGYLDDIANICLVAQHEACWLRSAEGRFESLHQLYVLALMAARAVM